MKEFLSYFLYAFTSLFTIVNPLGATPFYSGMTEGMHPLLARVVALRAAVSGFIAMVFFAVTGKFIFSFFNVSVDGLRVVGGILFFINGYDMLVGKEVRTKNVSPSERLSVQDVKVKAITPLAIPLICGPGTITVMSVLIEESNFLWQKGVLFFTAFLVSALTYLVLISSKKIISFVGESGQKVFIRFMGLILMMIAVEFFFTGLRPYIQRLIGA